MTTRPTLQDRAEAVPVDALGKAGQDARSGTEYARALAAEAERSLRRDPGRWPWRNSRTTPDNRRLRQGRGASHDLHAAAPAPAAPAAPAARLATGLPATVPGGRRCFGGYSVRRV